MPIDPSIPLSYRPTQAFMTPAQMLEMQQSLQQGQLIAQRLQQGTEAQQRQNMLSDIMARQGAYTPEGLPTPGTLTAVGQSGNPDVYNQMVQMVGLAQQRQQQAETQRQNMLKEYGDIVGKGRERAQLTYEQLIDQGAAPDVARERAGMEWSNVKNEWGRTGAVRGQMWDLVRDEPYDPDKFRFAVGNYQDWKKQQERIQEKGKLYTDASGNLYRTGGKFPIEIKPKGETEFGPFRGQLFSGMLTEVGQQPPKPEKPEKPEKGHLVEREDGTYLVDLTTGKSTKVMTPEGTPLPGKPKEVPASLIKDIAQNNVTLGNIRRALDLTEKNPNAFGLKNLAPEIAVEPFLTQEEIDTRALVANISTQRIHDRAGASQTVQETARLRPYIPNLNERPATVKTKLEGMQREYEAMQDELAQGKSILEAGRARGGREGGGRITEGRITPSVTPTPSGAMRDEEGNVVRRK